MREGLRVNLTIPDLWQQEAVRALQEGHDVVVQAPTGAGKTYIFELLYPKLKQQAVFTVPTRALDEPELVRRHGDRRRRLGQAAGAATPGAVGAERIGDPDALVRLVAK